MGTGLRKPKFIFYLFLSIIVISLIVPSVVFAESEKPVRSGLLDLRGNVIAEEGPFSLDGEWEFYWQEFRSPERFKNHLHHPPSQMAEVPSSWTRYRLDGERLPRHGYATYRMVILLDESDIGEIVSLYVPNIASAYQLWVNDQLYAANGVIGTSRNEMVPREYSRLVTFKADTEAVEIVIQASDYYQRKSGLWESFTFGTFEQIQQLRERNTLFQVFVVGSLFTIGLYHLALFFLRPKEKAPLYFAIVCLGVGIRSLLLRDILFAKFFPPISWNTAVNIEYISALIALLFLLLFVKQGLPKDVPQSLIVVFSAALIAYSLFVMFTPTYVFTNTVYILYTLSFSTLLAILIIYLIAVKRKREGAYLNLLATSVLFVAVMNDIFHYSDWITTDEFVSVGLLFYLPVQSILMSRRFARSFDKVEKLSTELQNLNRNLESKVKERTRKLREANERLQKMEKARRRLLASVSHELKTPITFIQGYIKAMLDGVISRDDSSYLRAIYDDSNMMSRIIQDLQELSKLESGQIQFNYEQVKWSGFFKQIYEKQKLLKNEGFHFEYLEKNERNMDDVIYIKIDPVRIEQVLMNFIVNAQKFTPAGGKIKIQVELIENGHKELKVSVTDNGPGIPEKDLPYVFDRFYKANHPQNAKERGAGLGLAIAKEIIQHHGGSVGVISEQGAGSSFFFTLPLHIVNG